MIELWTCHFQHWGWQHALLNAVAAVPPIVAMRRAGVHAGRSGAVPALGGGETPPIRPAGRQRDPAWLFLPFLFAAAPFIALAVRAGFAGEYRGASGLVVAMWVFAGVLLRNRVLLVVIAAKLAAEALGLLPSHDGFVTVSIAHYAGAAAGLIGGLTAGAGGRPKEATVPSPSIAHRASTG